MSLEKKKWETLIYSGAGVLGMFVILVAVGVILGAFKTRIDLTAERLYTLSNGTRKILSKIDSPVEIHFYCTRSETEMPVNLKNYARRVEDLLSEYRQAAGGGKIEIKKFDPQPDSDAEDSARLDGIQGQALGQGGMISLGERVYLGLAVICLDQKVAIPVLDPTREKLLEYDLTRAISRVVNPEKQNLGVLSGLPVFGGGNPMMMRMGQGGQEPWVFLTELRNDFNVKQIDTNVETIDEDIQVLLVFYPSSLSERTQYAIDQFVLRGGRMIAFLDPLSLVDSRNAMGMQNMLQRAASSGATLDKLLKAWGLEYDINKVIADKNYFTQVLRGDRPSPEPTWLSLTPEAIDQNDVATSQIDSILMPTPGVFTGTPATGLKQTVLLKTSGNSQTVDKMMAQFGGGDPGKDFVASGKEYALAVRLTGKFKTAFPDGRPAGKPEDKDEDKDSKPEGKSEDDKKGESLKESVKEGAVILVGDSDMLYDQFCVQIQNFFGQKLISPRNGNLAFLQNIVEQLMGDSNLIGVRSRAVLNRPFTRVKAIQAEAEMAYIEKIKKLEQDLTETRQKINDAQSTKDKSQRFILSQEQQDEIKKFRRREAEVNRELKQVRKQLRKDIDALETRLKWINIAGMPFFVTVAGISLAIVKRKKTAAK